jgi:hypothetical protein
MNPRKITDFLKSKFGLFVIFVVVLFGGLWMYGQHQAKEKELAKLAASNSKKVELGQVQIPLSQGLESGTPQQAKVAPQKSQESSDTEGGIVPFRPAPPPTPASAAAKTPSARGSKAAPKEVERVKKIKHVSLLGSYTVTPTKSVRETPKPPERFIPFGTMLKCKLVNTVDSSNLETPVIALLLEDVWQNGKKIIPANTLVHGTARAGRIRDRITAKGGWRFVWQDGRELPFNAVALDREYDHEIDGYGITDGSGGIKGRVLATDNLQELKLLASAALSGFAKGTQDRTQNALGTTLTGSISNGVKEGASDVFEMYARRTLKDIEDNGYFVRVSAGKEFYVYVLEAIDPQKAKIAGTNLPKDSEPSSETNSTSG